MEKKYIVFLFIFSCLGNNYAQDISQIYEKVNPAVVVVYSDMTLHADSTSVNPIGSGFMISNSEIITAANLIHVMDKVKIEFLDGEVRNAEVIALSKSADLAMVRLDYPKENAVSVSLGNSNELRHGMPIFIVVAPDHLKHSLSKGGIKKVVKSKRNIESIDYVITSAPIEPTYMGGPMFNAKGEVMGVVSHMLDITPEKDPIPYIITANTLKDLLFEELLEWNGINTRPLTGMVGTGYNLPQMTGLLVEHVESMSPLGKMGVQKEDIILSLADTKVEFEEETLEKMKDISHKLKAYEAFEMMVLRGDKVVFLNRE